MRRFVATLALVALAAAPAFADLRYKAKSTTHGDQPNTQGEILVEAWVKDANAEVHFRESGNPWMKSGFYMVTNDGGQTLFMVNPEEETYSEWDLDAVLRFAGNVMQSLGGVMKLEIQNSNYELVESKSDGELHGLDVTYYKFKFSYDMLMKIMGIKKAQHFEGESEIWATKELADQAIGVWLRRRAARNRLRGLRRVGRGRLGPHRGRAAQDARQNYDDHQEEVGDHLDRVRGARARSIRGRASGRLHLPRPLQAGADDAHRSGVDGPAAG